MSQDIREFYKGYDDDGCALLLTSLKEEAAVLRQKIWALEDEIRDRLTSRNARVLQGKAYRIRSSTKREIRWDQERLEHAQVVATSEGNGALFRSAFPLVFDCSIRNLNRLLALGGETSRAIEGAKREVREKLEITVEGLK